PLIYGKTNTAIHCHLAHLALVKAGLPRKVRNAATERGLIELCPTMCRGETQVFLVKATGLYRMVRPGLEPTEERSNTRVFNRPSCRMLHDFAAFADPRPRTLLTSHKPGCTMTFIVAHIRILLRQTRLRARNGDRERRRRQLGVGAPTGP